jgi:hypothetical protein
MTQRERRRLFRLLRRHERRLAFARWVSRQASKIYDLAERITPSITGDIRRARAWQFLEETEGEVIDDEHMARIERIRREM